MAMAAALKLVSSSYGGDTGTVAEGEDEEEEEKEGDEFAIALIEPSSSLSSHPPHEQNVTESNFSYLSCDVKRCIRPALKELLADYQGK